MKKLQDTADLFEVNFPDYKQLRQCRSDIILVKAVWDMVVFVKVNKFHTLRIYDLYMRFFSFKNHGLNVSILLSVPDQYRRLDQDSMERDQR